MRSATGGLRLLARHTRSGTGPSVLVAAVVLVCSFLALAAPLALGRLADAELTARVGGVSEGLRALTGDATTFPTSGRRSFDNPSGRGPVGTTAQVWEPVTGPVDHQRATLPRPLRDGTRAPLFEVRTPDSLVTADSPHAIRLALAADPGFDARVRWVEGTAPALWSGDPARFDDPSADLGSDAPLPIGLSARAAATMGLKVGDVLGRGRDLPLVVSGLYRLKDPDAVVWRLHPRLDEAVRNYSTDGELQYLAVGVVSPRTPALDGPLRTGTLSMIIPIRAGAWDAEDASRVSAQLSATTARGIELGSSGDTTVVLLTTDTTAAVDGAIALTAAISTVTALAASGSVAVALLALALGTGAVIDRRRPAIDLAAARGASPLLLRGAAALEGAVLGIPAAVVGAALAAVLLPRTIPLGALALCAVLGVSPTVVGFARATPGSLRAARTDLGMRRGRGWRWAIETAVLVLAAAVTAALLVRGRAQDAAQLDPLLVVAPVLLAVGVGLLTLRFYPVPLRLAQAVLHRGRRAAALLGVARGIREPTIGLAAALAILTGVSVGVLSAVLVGTVDAATREAARSAVGADIRADLSVGDPGGRVPRVAGIDDLATLAPQRAVSFEAASVDLVSAPTTTLHRIRPEVPSRMDRMRDGAIPIVVSDDVDERVGAHVRLAEHEAVVVGRLPVDAGLGSTRQWALVDQRFLRELVSRPTRATLLLADVDPGASVRAIAARLRAELPGGAIVTDVQTRYDRLRAIPSVGGLSAALVAATASAAVLALLTAVLSVVAATRRRDRTVALLRVLGLSRAQGRAMVVAELAPIAVALVVGGTALGIGLAELVTGVIDLRPFTRGAADAPAVLAPLPIALVAVGFLALSAIAAAVAARLSSRVRPADVIRTGE